MPRKEVNQQKKTFGSVANNTTVPWEEMNHILLSEADSPETARDRAVMRGEEAILRDDSRTLRQRRQASHDSWQGY
jgi:hypothetical protein